MIQPESLTDVAEAAVMDQKLADQNLTGYVLDILSRSHSMEKSINQLLEIGLGYPSSEAAGSGCRSSTGFPYIHRNQ